MLKTKLIIAIGVALNATPIFYSQSALAQGTTQQANIVIEIQQLRAEMAELRDMIERQQYQIKRLQQQTSNSNVGASAPAPQVVADALRPAPASNVESTPAVGSTTVVSAPDGVVAPQVQVIPPTQVQPTQVQQVQTSQPTVTVGDQTTAQQAPVNPASASQAASQSAPQTDAEFYRPYEAVDVVEVEIQNSEVASAAQQAADSYPPVVDRSIGGVDGAQVPAVPQQRAPVVDQSVGQVQATAQQSVPTNQAVSVPVEQARPVQVPASVSVGQDTPTAAPQAVPQPVVVSQAPVTQGAVITQAPSQASSAPAGVIPVPAASNTVEASQSLPTTQAGVNAPVNASAAVPAPVTVQNNDAQLAQPVNVPATVTTVLSENDLYKQGFDLLKEFKNDDAVAVFKQQIGQYPEGEYADDAHYWIAESMYLNRDLDQSKKYFRTLIASFSDSPRVPDAMLKTAYIEQDQGNEIEARILLQEIIQYHPRSDAAISAKNRLEQLN